jgi:hypothetical protein
MMPGPERSDSDLEVLRAVALQPQPFATANDVEPRLSVGYKQTRNRLDQLVDERGWLLRRKVAGVNVYWLSDAGRDMLAESSCTQ